ncbi:Clavaminate synthase-like protein [Saccharata proteae CBS 121410]|uniref:Clavaminate synthase-like protein n=1 Tax=Saccharata proteae CBS 121410 TaxID=1314787 RepID=A0A9P4LRR1_9PEZI|nr:Clavaminate synthase-like protein [Saccharata proteae CBS 121410]
MAPGAINPEPVETVTFHAGKGKQTRTVLTGAAAKPTFSSIPLVDFTKAFSPSLSDRKAVASEVGAAFRSVGFLYAANHGIPADLQASTYAVIREFFALPTEEKMKIHINKSPVIKGYERLLETRIDDSTRGDLKEAFNMSDDPYEPEQNAPADLDLSTYPPPPLNQWPEQPARFRQTLYAYHAAVSAFARRLLRIVALALELDEHYFDHMTRFPMAGLRALHYPPQEASTDVGIGAHADYSWFTLVNQLSSTPALEVLNANGHWIPAPPIPNTLVVNVGDFLERATNDRFVSTVHRVVNRTGEERFSLPYFFSPSQDVVIRTVESCLDKDGKGRYEDIVAGDWQRERLLRARVNHPASVAARERGEI